MYKVLQSLLCFLILICVSKLHAQSKNEHIILLTKKVDSLSNLLNTERANNLEQVKLLKSEINNKDFQLKKMLSQFDFGASNKNLAEFSSNSNEFIEVPIKSIKIGKQVWMTENLNVFTFRNGDTIPQARNKTEWVEAGENGKPAWCYYENDVSNGVKYGKLYNWHAVNDSRGLAPVGWKIPEFEDFNALDTYLWGEVGRKIKCSSGWKSWSVEERCKTCIGWSDDVRKVKHCNTCKDSRVTVSKNFPGNGTNSSGFSALPGGFRDSEGEFEKIGEHAHFWSSTPQYTLYGRMRVLTNMDSELIMNYATKDFGLSIRCLKE